MTIDVGLSISPWKEARLCSVYAERQRRITTPASSSIAWSRLIREPTKLDLSQQIVFNECATYFVVIVMLQFFAYNKISRQPAFHGGNTTAPIF